MAVSVYLDVCCLQRPFDDLSQTRVRVEAEAVTLILSYVEENRISLVSSEAIDYEVNRISNTERANRTRIITRIASHYAVVDDVITLRTVEVIKLGFSALDALHISCAEAGKATVFLTTDDKLLKRAVRLRNQLRVDVANPVTWLGETKTS